MKKYTIILMVLIQLFATLISAQEKKPIVNIGIIVDGEWENSNELLNELKDEINDLLQNEFNIQYPSNALLNGNWDVNKLQSLFNQLLQNENIDLIITAGEIISSIAIFYNEELNKPVVAPFAANAKRQHMPLKNGASGVKNLSYITFTSSLESQVALFNQLTSFNKAALLVNELYFADFGGNFPGLSSSLDFGNTSLVPIKVSPETGIPAAPIPDDVEAVIALPLFFLSNAQVTKIVNEVQSKEKPFLGVFDLRYIQAGALALTSFNDFFPRISRRIALNIQQILLGSEPGEISVDFPIKDEMTINMVTARELAIYPNWSLMSSSNLMYNEAKQVDRKITLFDVLYESVRENLDLRIKAKELEVNLENISSARSSLLPQIDVSATGLLVDKDLAEGSAGQQAERTLSGSLNLQQIIYNEKVWANLDIQNINQKIISTEREQLELDIIFETATAYLNLLRAKTGESIQKDNLNASSSNLEIARFRESVGNARASEVFRWESEIANNRKNVIEAVAERNLAEIDLNRILNRPIEESFETLDDDLDTLIQIIADRRLAFYYDNKWHFEIFREFVAQEAIKNSPEVKLIDHAIKIQERSLKSANSSFFLPTLALQAQANNTFYRGGAGSEVEPITIPGLVTLDLLSEPKDFSWNVALNFSLPLFQGGARFADVSKSKLEISRLALQREQVKNAIEQQVRSALHLSGASYAGMEQAKFAAEAAMKNLDLVVDAYQRGAVSIIELIDAQTAALTSNLLASNSRYQFLIDLIRLQRAGGQYAYKWTREERHDFFDRLKLNFDENIGK